MQLNFEIGRRSLTRLLIREKQETQREVNMMTEADVSIGEMEVGEEREREGGKQKKNGGKEEQGEKCEETLLLPLKMYE